VREDGFEITSIPRLNPSLCESFGLLGVHCSSCWKTSVSVIARGELGYRRCYEATRRICDAMLARLHKYRAMQIKVRWAHSPFRRRVRSMRAPKVRRTLPLPLVLFRVG